MELRRLSLPQVLEIVERLRSLLWKRYGPHFKGLVLYGSCARGDHEEGSDIDLLVLMDDEMDLRNEERAISELRHKLSDKCLKYGTLLAPVLVREGEYQRGKSPFFLNVKREGISFAPGDRIDMQPEIDDLIDRARRNLSVARDIFEGENYDIAASRAYYAMFYAAEAALLSRGTARSRHSGVIAAFNEYFVRTGLLPDTLATDLSNAFDQRNEADYGRQLFPREQAETMLKDAEEFVIAVERFLTSQ